MKKIIQVCVVSVLLSWAFNPSFSQTKLISHKSHSGATHQLTLSGGDHFGEPGPRVYKVEKVSDSLAVFHDHFYGNDSVFHSPVLKMSVDSIKMVYGDYVEILGFDKRKPKQKEKAKDKQKSKEKLKSKEKPKAKNE